MYSPARAERNLSLTHVSLSLMSKPWSGLGRCNVAFQRSGIPRAKQPFGASRVQLHLNKSSPLFSWVVRREIAPNHPLTGSFEHFPPPRALGQGTCSLLSDGPALLIMPKTQQMLPSRFSPFSAVVRCL